MSSSLYLYEEIYEEKSCREKDGIVQCHTLFSISVVFVNDSIGIIIQYRNRKYYLPPIVSNDRVPLPLKYAKFFDPIVFPEILPAKYGRR